jgi:hypothetical protein
MNITGPPLDQVDAVVEDLGLLLPAHRDRVLMTVAVDADLVSGRNNLVELPGEVSMEWPGQNQVAGSSYLVSSAFNRGTPTSPAKTPREMSSGESSPP